MPEPFEGGGSDEVCMVVSYLFRKDPRSMPDMWGAVLMIFRECDICGSKLVWNDRVGRYSTCGCRRCD